MIEFRNVVKAYKDNVVLNDVSLHIDDGEFVFVVGASGAGKSTFIKLITRELEPDSGSIIVDGTDISLLSRREIPEHRRHIGMVFQDYKLLPHKTVYENVAFAMEVTKSPKRTIQRHVPQILQIMGIDDAADKFPDELSGGEQQRVAIARAIINNPRLLIADEPTGNLDEPTAMQIMKLLNQINRRGTTVLMVTHSKEIVGRFGKRIIEIDNGKIVQAQREGAHGFDD